MNHTRDAAIVFLKEKLPNPNLQRHCLAVESIMRALAQTFNEPVDEWGLAGLLHDIDYEATEKDLSQHSLLAAEWLSERDYPVTVVQAIKVHNANHGLPQTTPLEKWLPVADAVSGIIVATALMLPNKAEDLTVNRIKKRMKDKAFARGVDRQEILQCEQLGMQLETFLTISLKAVQSAAKELGLTK